MYIQCDGTDAVQSRATMSNSTLTPYLVKILFSPFVETTTYVSPCGRTEPSLIGILLDDCMSMRAEERQRRPSHSLA